MTSGIVSQNTVVDQQQNCLEMASNFLFALSKEKKYTFQTFDDSKNKHRKLARILHGTLEEHFLELMQLNSDGAGVFVTVNETDFKGRETSNIIKIRACFVDLDGAPLVPVLEAPIQPHIVIESSPERYHAYWLIDGLPLDQFRNVQKALAAKFNSDPKVIDLPRVMRLVGFNHQKKEPFLSRIINQNFDPPIKADKFLSVFQINLSEERTQNENPILQAIREKGIFLGKTSKSGQWNIKCPWAHQHTTEGVEACYLEPNTDGYLGHGFKCFHKHCENRRGKDLLEWLGIKNADEWETPILLPEELPPVASLEKDMLPDALGDWVWDIADRMQIPPDFSAVAAIVVIGSLIGRKIGIFPKKFDDWLVVPNLFGAVVGRPSLLKSPAIAEVVKLLDRLILDASKEYQANLDIYELQEMAVKARKEAYQDRLKKAAKGKDSEKNIENILADHVVVEPLSEPILKRYKSEDATTEKIGEILLQNPNGILIHRDELTGWLKSLDKDGREGDRAFYLEAWNGSGTFTIDRIKRGTLHIPALCLSIIGGIQPGPLSSYVYQTYSGGSGDDGLLQRFQLLVWPDVPKEWKNIDRLPDAVAKNRVYEIFKQLDRFTTLIDPLVLGTDIPAIHFSEDAQKIFDHWRANLEQRIRSGDMSPALESHLGKYRSLLPSLNLIFQLCNDLDQVIETTCVNVEAINRAIKWCSYLETHAVRLYSSAVNHRMESAKALLKKIQKKEVRDGFTSRDVYANHWSKLSDTEEVKAATEILIMCGWIRFEEIKTNGRPKQIFKIHPQLRIDEKENTSKT